MNERRITRIAEVRRQQKQETEEVLAAVATFAKTLYSEIVGVIEACTRTGISDLSPGKKTELRPGLDSFSFVFGNHRMILQPVIGAALPNAKADFGPFTVPQRPAGRIVIFIQYVDEPLEATAIGDIYVFGDHKWAGTGLARGQGADSISRDRLSDLALAIVELVGTRIESNHRSLSETTLNQTTATRENPVGLYL